MLSPWLLGKTGIGTNYLRKKGNHACHIGLSYHQEGVGMGCLWHKPGLHIGVWGGASRLCQYIHVRGWYVGVCVPMDEENWARSNFCHDIYGPYTVKIRAIECAG